MKTKLLTFLLLLLTFAVYAQPDVAPTDSAYHNLSAYSVRYYTRDGSVWMFMGKYGSAKLARAKDGWYAKALSGTDTVYIHVEAKDTLNIAKYMLHNDSINVTGYATRGYVQRNFVAKNDSSKLYELKSNKVTSISGASTDIQYPSAKLLNDELALYSSGTGTDGYVPNFHGTNTFENSPLWTDGTNIGWGTFSPLFPINIVTQSNIAGISLRRSSTTTNEYVSYGFRVSTDASDVYNDAEIKLIRIPGQYNLSLEGDGIKVSIPQTIASTSTTTGALVVGGGVGVAGNVISGGFVQATTGKYTNLTDGYITYHISDAIGLGNSPFATDGTKVALGTVPTYFTFDVNGSIVSKTLSLTNGYQSGGTLEFNPGINSTHGKIFTSYWSGTATGLDIGTYNYQTAISISNVDGAVSLTGNLTANSFIKIGGTSAQYLLADGSTTTTAGAVYKGTVNGTNGAASWGGTIADGTGTTGWYAACLTAGTYNYGSGNITLAVGDQLYYNGTIWLKVPGAGSYTLPIATASPGGVITNGNVSVNASTGGMTVLTNANLTGDVTSSGNATTIAAKAVTLAKMNDMATASVIGRSTAGTGVPEVLALSGLNIGGNAATVTTNANLTGVVTSVGNTTSFSANPSFSGTLSNSGVIKAGGNLGFQNDVYSLNVPNPIWSFGNASGYGIAYYHGTALTGGDAIGFHFGTIGTPPFYVSSSGIITTASTGTSTDWNAKLAVSDTTALLFSKERSAKVSSYPTFNQSTTGNAATATNLTGLTTSVATLNALPNLTVQALSGTTPAWNATSGINATLTLSGNTTITLSNLVAGTSGNITLTNPATAYTITMSGYTNKISPGIYTSANVITASGGSKIDCLSWFYDGSKLLWNGTKDYK